MGNKRSIDQLKKINEGKLQFSTMPSLKSNSNYFNLKQLASLSGLSEDIDLSDDITDDTVSSDNIDTSMDDSMSVDDMINSDQGMVTDVTVVPVETSEAMSSILDNINNIQTNLPDIRLYEFKQLIIKLDELSSQARSMGASYLSERRLRK